MKLPSIPPILLTPGIDLFTLLLATLMLATAVHAGGADSDPMATNAASPTSLTADPQLESSPVAKKSKPKEAEPLIVKLMGMTIGLVAVVLGIGIGILAVWTDYKKRHDIITACHRERMAALEKGLELPPYPPDWLAGHPQEAPTPRSPVKDLKAGLMWLTIGVGIVIYLSLREGSGIHPSIGAVPIGIGVAYLICYAVERRTKETQSVD